MALKGVYVQLSLREWVNYVLRIRSLDFQRHVGFVCLANIVLRRQRITGVAANKSISAAISETVRELVRIAHSNQIKSIPYSTLNVLINKLSVYLNNLPGSLANMSSFRNDILAMISKQGPPSFFVTVSSADSMWPEVYVELSSGNLSLENAKKASASERVDMASANPVRMTIAWKKRVEAFLKLIVSGKSKPLQEITHFAHKSQCQGRLSEHSHFLFWSKRRIPNLQFTDEGDLRTENQELLQRAEASCTAMLPDYDVSTEAPKNIFEVIAR